jgi:hypothetical protein
MESIIWVACALVLIGLLVPVLLFGPVLTAIAKRIAPRQADPAEMKVMQKRMAMLEQQLEHMHIRLTSVEENHEFSKRMLEDISKKSIAEKGEQPSVKKEQAN